MQVMVTLTANDSCPEMLAAIRIIGAPKVGAGGEVGSKNPPADSEKP